MAKSIYVGMMVSTNGVMLFSQNGAPTVLQSNMYDTKKLLKYITPMIASSNFPEIDIEEYNIQSVLTDLKGLNAVDLTAVSKTGEVRNIAGLSKHVNRAAYDGNAKGLAKFMISFNEIKNKHTAEGLVKFLEVSDLPIADDGSIVAYKILNVRDGKWVDPHTNSVVQSIGSMVFMPRSKVNESSQLCSVGLHVCSYQYIYGFGSSGKVVCLVKVSPKDVIVATPGEFKMRVSGYQICAVLPPGFTESDSKSAMIGNDTNSVLANVVAGNHPSINNLVEVGVAGVHSVTAVEERKSLKKPKPVKVMKFISDADILKDTQITPIEVNAMVAAATSGDFSAALNAVNPPVVKKQNGKATKQLKTVAVVVQLTPFQIANIQRMKEYEVKVKKAEAHLAAGLSKTAVCKLLKMDRESLTKALANKS